MIEIGKGMRDVYLVPLVEKPYKTEGKKPPKVLLIDLLLNPEDEVIFQETRLISYSPDDSIKRYYFREPFASQGPAPSLSFKLPKKPSGLQQRLGILNILGYKADTKKITQDIVRYRQSLEKSGEIHKNTPILIVLRINRKWPAENERLKEKFGEIFWNYIGSYKKKIVWKRNSICHGCGKENAVYGGVGNLLKFYTVDKYGYAPELDPVSAWKQYALCRDCILDLERGKRAVNDFLTWRFYGRPFWLLPVSRSPSYMKEILDKFKEFYSEVEGKAHKDAYEEFEDELIEMASKIEWAISYHFVFTREDNQAVRILLHIEEVLPSVLQNFIDKKRETQDSFKELILEEAFQNISWNIGFNFFSSPALRANQQSPGFTDKDFFMLVDKVFRRSLVDENYLISKAMMRIRKDLVQNDRTGIPIISILETFLSLVFLLTWGILKRTAGGATMSTLPYESFFELHKDFFNHPAKVGLVLLGVLVQKFLNYQHRERGSTPFLKTLKNLRLDKKDVQSVYLALQNKMNEYGIARYWGKLREGIARSFIEAGDSWHLSTDEIGFYITIGMALHSHEAFKEEP